MIPKQVFQQTILGHLAPIVPFLEDPSVTEVMINGHQNVFIERGGLIHRTTVQFASEEALTAALRNLAQYAGRSFGPDRPILEARLPDGSRVEAILPPAAEGVQVAIRRFSRETLTMARLVGLGSLTEDAAQTLAVLVAAKQNIVVAGGTGSGKTSFLNALSSFTGEEERIVVIEDNRELQLQRPHVVQLEAQPPDPRGHGQVTIRDLFRATLRMRPDRIVVGEVRGGEALDLVQAMTSGHGGCLTTVHASHPRDAVARIETLALMSDVELPLGALRAQVASAIDIIVHTARAGDGSRVVSHVSEVAGYDPQRGYDIRDLSRAASRARTPAAAPSRCWSRPGSCPAAPSTRARWASSCRTGCSRPAGRGGRPSRERRGMTTMTASRPTDRRSAIAALGRDERGIGTLQATALVVALVLGSVAAVKTIARWPHFACRP